MESSTVVAFRALVLVACLIVVPLAAIFGSQFPDVVKSVLIDRIFPNGLPGIAGADVARDTAPPFVATSESPSWQSGQTGPAVAGAPVSPQPGTGVAPAWPGAGVEPAVAWNPTPGQVRPAAGEGLSGGQPGGAERLGVAMPADGRPNPHANPNAGLGGNGAPGVGGPANPSAHLVTPPDRFTLMERRLREFGATYYLLETWGNDSEYYRFHCKMAIANNPTHTRQFEATDTDPLRAMARVVEQVEAWRGGRLP
ncbi:MAG TPA: hypothetical protein VHY91_22450 [Pirellulales bacterium]|jgi:hypothetical protein|nr:hypothetical protein [Pirellulales bacterium]